MLRQIDTAPLLDKVARRARIGEEPHLAAVPTTGGWVVCKMRWVRDRDGWDEREIERGLTVYATQAEAERALEGW